MLWCYIWFGDIKFNVFVSNQNLVGLFFGFYVIYWFGGIIVYIVFVVVYVFLFMLLMQVEGGIVFVEIMLWMMFSIYFVVFVGMLVWGFLGLFYQVVLLCCKVVMVGLDDVCFCIYVGLFGYFWVVVGNMLIIVFSLGFVFFIVQMCMWCYIFSKMEVFGEFDFDVVYQNFNKGFGFGEGFVDVFDIGNVIQLVYFGLVYGWLECLFDSGIFQFGW